MEDLGRGHLTLDSLGVLQNGNDVAKGRNAKISQIFLVQVEQHVHADAILGKVDRVLSRGGPRNPRGLKELGPF